MNLSLSDYLLIVLATWRVCLMFSSEEGAWSIFERLRARAGVVINASNGQAVGKTTLARGLLCVWCLSVWVVPAMWAIQAFVPIVNLWLAFSMGVVIVHEIFQRVRR